MPLKLGAVDRPCVLSCSRRDEGHKGFANKRHQKQGHQILLESGTSWRPSMELEPYGRENKRGNT